MSGKNEQGNGDFPVCKAFRQYRLKRFYGVVADIEDNALREKIIDELPVNVKPENAVIVAWSLGDLINYYEETLKDRLGDECYEIMAMAGCDIIKYARGLVHYDLAHGNIIDIDVGCGRIFIKPW